MATFIAIVLGLTAFGAIVYPLVKRRGHGSAVTATEETSVQGLLDERDHLLQLLTDLENDRQLGKVSEGDYHALRAENERDIIRLFVALDATAGDLRDTIEAEIQAARDMLAQTHDSSGAEPLIEGQASADHRLDNTHQAPEGGIR